MSATASRKRGGSRPAGKPSSMSFSIATYPSIDVSMAPHTNFLDSPATFLIRQPRKAAFVTRFDPSDCSSRPHRLLVKAAVATRSIDNTLGGFSLRGQHKPSERSE